MTTLVELRALVLQLRRTAPATADILDRAIAEIEGGRLDAATVNVKISGRLEKYDGDYRPGMTPVEIIEIED